MDNQRSLFGNSKAIINICKQYLLTTSGHLSRLREGEERFSGVVVIGEPYLNNDCDEFDDRAKADISRPNIVLFNVNYRNVR